MQWGNTLLILGLGVLTSSKVFVFIGDVMFPLRAGK